MKKAIQLGAGNIGRGFIGALLSGAGYEVVFADVSEPIIEALNRDKGYCVHILDTECRDIEVTNVRAVNSTTDAVVEEMATAEIITTAVGPVVLARVAPTIAKAIKARMTAGTKSPLHVIACENAVRASSFLKTEVYKALDAETVAYADANVGFVDSAVDRIVPPVRLEKFTDVVVETFFEWDVEKSGFIGEIPAIDGMTVVENLEAYVERKLFTLNTGHAITAYLGCLKGYATIDKAIADEVILRIVQSAMTESGTGLVRKHNLDMNAQMAYIQKILSRFRNAHLNDDVTRVGREPLRKLLPTDRLIKPLMTAYNFGLPVDHMIIGVAAALNYNNPDDAQSVELQADISEIGVKETLKKRSELKDEELLERIEELYFQVAKL